MSLPSVEWRYVGTSYASGNIDILMDTIYTLATGTEYIDGSPRTQGSGSAGTWSRYQTGGGVTEAIYVTPPSGDAKIIIAGSSGTPSPVPTMATSDTSYYANTLMMNITKNAGAFTTWNSGNPFTSGTTFGYWRILGSRSANAGITGWTGNIYLYESKESVAVFLIQAAIGSTSTSYSNGGIAGALWDPESSSSSDAESDGRTYGMITSGHQSNLNITNASWDNTNIWGTNQFTAAQTTAAGTTRGFFHGHSTNNSGAHCGMLIPNSSGVKTGLIMMYPIQSSAGSSLKTPSGKYARIPLIYKFTDTLDLMGRLREISLVNRGLIGQRHADGATTIGYTVGCSDAANAPADCLLFEY